MQLTSYAHAGNIIKVSVETRLDGVKTYNVFFSMVLYQLNS